MMPSLRLSLQLAVLLTAGLCRAAEQPAGGTRPCDNGTTMETCGLSCQYGLSVDSNGCRVCRCQSEICQVSFLSYVFWHSKSRTFIVLRPLWCTDQVKRNLTVTECDKAKWRLEKRDHRLRDTAVCLRLNTTYYDTIYKALLLWQRRRVEIWKDIEN